MQEFKRPGLDPSGLKIPEQKCNLHLCGFLAENPMVEEPGGATAHGAINQHKLGNTVK